MADLNEILRDDSSWTVIKFRLKTFRFGQPFAKKTKAYKTSRRQVIIRFIDQLCLKMAGERGELIELKLSKRHKKAFYTF